MVDTKDEERVLLFDCAELLVEGVQLVVKNSKDVRPVLEDDGKTAYVAALEDILVWDVKKGQLLATWHDVGMTAAVTALARNPSDKDIFAVGYADGTIRLWRSSTAASFLTFHGHKGSVTCIRWDQNGMRFASGGQDTSIIVWDAVGEQGLFRLHGHRDMITDLSLLNGPDTQGSHAAQAGQSRLLVSVSKDALMKVWDLELQHCIETVAPGDGQLWSVTTEHASELPSSEQSQDAFLIVTGGSEGQIKLWECSVSEAESNDRESRAPSTSKAPPRLIPTVKVELQGSLTHNASKRVSQLDFVAHAAPGRPEIRHIAALTSDKTLQTFLVRSAQDVRKKMARRAKRNKSKVDGKNAGMDKDQAPAEEIPAGQLPWPAQVEVGEILRPEDGRIRKFAFSEPRKSAASLEGKSTHAKVLFMLSSNALEVQRLALKTKKGKETEGSETLSGPMLTLDMAGHRSEVRAIAFSHGGDTVASACSAGLVKVWNLATGSCLRTMPSGYALSLSWLPDDSHLIVGCKDGSIHTYDVTSGSEVESIAAHEGPVWSIGLRPDGAGLVSGSADKTVKFWNFSTDAENDEEDESDGEMRAQASGTGRLVLDHVRTLKMADDILSVGYSPNGKLLAVALLDSTVKIFYADTLKFFLSLYGHKLPVLTFDISQDSKLIVTGSADKNVKIWGLDFGDCHRSLIAHTDSVMAVQFEKGKQGGGLMGGREGDSHRFWSVGKDGLLKFWDGDNFEAVQTLRGHHDEIWALSVDDKGSKVVTSGADRSIRLWEKTDEPLFLEEEREREMEMIYQNAGTTRDDDERAIGELAEGEGAGGGDPRGGVTMVSATNDASLTTGERLIEAIETADRDRIEQAQPLPPPRNAGMLAGLQEGDEQTPARYTFRVVEKIPPSQLTDVLLLLPFSSVVSLFTYIDTWLQKEWSLSLSSRVLFFLIRTHHAQIVSNAVLRKSLGTLRKSLRDALTRSKSVIGFNSSGLRFVRDQIDARKQADAFDPFVDSSSNEVARATKRKLQV